MADRSFGKKGCSPGPRRGSSRSGHSRSGPSRSLAAVGLATGLLVGCGTTAEPGTGAIAPTTMAIATTTTTLPPETTTTIDFNRPVDQQVTPLPEDALIADLAEVTNDMRGQTDDVYQQMIRLIDFPKLASPIGSQILDFSAVVRTDEDQLRAESTVSVRAPATSDLVKYFAGEMEARTWYDSDLTRETTETGERTTTLFRLPGFGEEKELTVAVEAMPGLTLIDLEYHSVIEDDADFELLQSWQEKVRTPGSAEVVSAGVSTGDNVGTAVVTYQLVAETTAEARTDMLDVVRASEFETTAVAVENDGSPVILVDVETGDELRLEFFETVEEDVVEMTVTATFPLVPLD